MLPDGSLCSISMRQLHPDAEFLGCEDVRVRAAAADSRSVEPGQVFVALRGTTSNGHDFATQAVRRGAVGLVLEAPLPDIAIAQCVVPDTRVAWARLCHALAGNPSQKLNVIGITGTNGKSTTAYLVRSILQTSGAKVGLIGTIEQFDGQASIPAMLTTPGSDVLAKLMQRMVSSGCSHVVMEVSSHALDQHRVAGIRFDTAVFTNLTQDHLDYHGNMAAYRQAKSRLFQELGASGCAVLNMDDAASQYFRRLTPGLPLGYSVRGVADFSAIDVRTSLEGCQFGIESRSGRCELSTPLIGLHNVYNCMAAATVARRLGLDWDLIRHGIEQLSGVPGRLEAVRCGQPFHVFVDYAHTSEALASVLQGLRGLTSGKLLCLFGAGGDRDRGKRPLMAQAAESAADVIVLTSDNPRTEDPEQIITEIAAGFTASRATVIKPDRKLAIEFVLSLAEPGDCVLIAGKGHENYQILGTDRIPFDDRQIAAESLSRLGGALSISSGAGTEKRQSVPPRGRIACSA